MRKLSLLSPTRTRSPSTFRPSGSAEEGSPSLRNRLHYPPGRRAVPPLSASPFFSLLLLSHSSSVRPMDPLLSLLSLRSKKLLTLRFIADSFGKYEQDGGRVGSRPSGVAASRAGVKGERQRVPPSLPPSLECSSGDGKRRFRRRSERERRPQGGLGGGKRGGGGKSFLVIRRRRFRTPISLK